MSPGQVARMLNELGLSVEFEDDTHVMIFCPYHDNRHTASCSVAKNTGYYFCHGASCGSQGRFVQLVRHVRPWDAMRAMRFIEKHSTGQLSVEKILEEIYADKDEMPEFPAHILSAMQQAYLDNAAPQDYISSRGIKPVTARHFGLGYDSALNMVVVPMFDTDNRNIGVIGRTISGQKRFKNSKKLPSKKSLFNINNAKRAGSENLVLVESSFDAIRIHQAGYPNVCATLGGTFSPFHLSQVNRHFNRLVLMIDVDEPGMKFAESIANKVRESGTSVYRGRYSESEIFPDGAKDACDMSDEDIAWCIRNASIMI